MESDHWRMIYNGQFRLHELTRSDVRLICPFRFLKRESVLEWVWGIGSFSSAWGFRSFHSWKLWRI